MQEPPQFTSATDWMLDDSLANVIVRISKIVQSHTYQIFSDCWCILDSMKHSERSFLSKAEVLTLFFYSSRLVPVPNLIQYNVNI